MQFLPKAKICQKREFWPKKPVFSQMFGQNIVLRQLILSKIGYFGLKETFLIFWYISVQIAEALPARFLGQNQNFASFGCSLGHLVLVTKVQLKHAVVGDLLDFGKWAKNEEFAFVLEGGGVDHRVKLFHKGMKEGERWKASSLMQRMSYPTETVLSNKITRNRIVLSF